MAMSGDGSQRLAEPLGDPRFDSFGSTRASSNGTLQRASSLRSTRVSSNGTVQTPAGLRDAVAQLPIFTGSKSEVVPSDSAMCSFRLFNSYEDTSVFSLPQRIELIEYRSQMNEATSRKHSANMLMLGAFFGFCGFAFASILGFIQMEPSYFPRRRVDQSYCFRYDGERLNPCYFPATVSEMVHNVNSPTGKIFFFYEFTGAMLIFFSAYPYKLRSVYIGDDYKMPCIKISWIALRQYVPPLGMMMLAIITTVPFAQVDILDLFCVSFHLVGAGFMFIGYFLAEAATVGWGPFTGVPSEKKHFHGRAKALRRMSLHVIFVNYVVFCILQIVLCTGDTDKWAKPPKCDIAWNVDCSMVQLIEAASGVSRGIKIASYASEVICGLALIFSHLVIWFYCEERHYNLPEELLHMPEEVRALDLEFARLRNSLGSVDSTAPTRSQGGIQLRENLP